MRLEALLYNYGKIYRKHIKHALKAKYGVIEVSKAQSPKQKRLKAYRNKTAGVITNKACLASRDLEKKDRTGRSVRTTIQSNNNPVALCRQSLLSIRYLKI